MRTLIALGAATAALGACGGSGGNDQPVRNRMAPAGNGVATAGESGSIAINEQGLLDACLPANERARTVDQLTPARRATLNRCYNEETVRQLTPRLPIRIDSRTEVDRVSAEGQALVYRYRIGLRLAELRPGLAERLEADTRRHACTGEDVRNIVALGGAQVYRWVDRDRALIREVRVDSCPAEGTATQ
jgi:hypothetical protein